MSTEPSVLLSCHSCNLYKQDLLKEGLLEAYLGFTGGQLRLLKIRLIATCTVLLSHSIQSCYCHPLDARSPTLEPDTLHPRLRLSESRETVSCGWLWKSYPDGPLRFDKLWQVLSRDSFFAGRHYWEVDLHRACKGWWIGAAYRSMSRKGDTEASRLGWNRGSWCMKRFDLEYWAFHNGTRTLVLLEEDTDRIGVFLDYEAGTLSFFDAMCGMRHLYTFKANFTEPVYPALRLWEGAITFCKLT
ncbi:tripartite motif-containing protein 14-like [Acipenser ruthenus]|uniref:tripartite motif-containing protein 14-like n=1 Tax=Acipenser ruthenus TaxID=7906 RepID=UPI00145A4D9B|nr:tripartite motif-containing protein 14-like [Acipenser ruthenus]